MSMNRNIRGFTMARKKLPIWAFTCKDNGGKFQVFNIKAENKQTAITKGFEKARKYAKGDIISWNCKLSIIQS